MQVELHPGERVDSLQFNNMTIIQKDKAFRFGMDAVLLSDFMRANSGDRIADFGTGTGVLPLLLYARNKGSRYDAFQIQKQMAEMASRSVEMNELQSVITIHHASIAQAPGILGDCSVDAIICNPPYGMAGTTMVNQREQFSLARHQTEQGLAPWFKAAHRILKGKGRFSIIYPAPRMLQVMDELQSFHLMPKRFRLIYPSATRAANLVLIQAVKDGRPMLHPQPPLIVYEQDGSPTMELKRIYHQEGDA